jgi:hypothetical protein
MASPLSTLFDGEFSVNRVFSIELICAEVLGLNLPSLCCWRRSSSVWCPANKGLLIIILYDDYVTFFFRWSLSIDACLYTLLILMNTFETSINVSFYSTNKSLRCLRNTCLFLCLFKSESTSLQSSEALLSNRYSYSFKHKQEKRFGSMTKDGSMNMVFSSYML